MDLDKLAVGGLVGLGGIVAVLSVAIPRQNYLKEQEAEKARMEKQLQAENARKAEQLVLPWEDEGRVWSYRLQNRATGKVDSLEFKIPQAYFDEHSRETMVLEGGADHAAAYIAKLNFNDRVLHSLARYITSQRFLPERSLESKAQRIVDFVYSLPYVKDRKDTSIIRHPLNTLLYGGDCEDKAGLALALMRPLGIDAGMIVLRGNGKVEGHVATGIRGNFEAADRRIFFAYNGKQYLFGEVAGFSGNEENDPHGISADVIGQMNDQFRNLLSDCKFYYPICPNVCTDL